MDHTAERFVKWEPTRGLPRVDPKSIAQDFGKNGGLHISLVEPYAGGKAFRIDFARALAFRSANESFRLKVLESLRNELPWPTFNVEDSEWVQWFHDQTFGAYRDWPVKHFLFIGEDVIEVLSSEAPAFVEIQD
jgi:hypothetical protein